MTQFTYKITEFNEELKTLRVTFDDGGWALINLQVPLPTTEEEIDNVVKRYTAPIEVVEARTSNTNINFIQDMIGTSRTTNRFSMNPIPTSNNTIGAVALPGEVLL